MGFFSGLWLDEDGAQLVEWVVIAALISFTGIAIFQVPLKQVSVEIT